MLEPDPVVEVEPEQVGSLDAVAIGRLETERLLIPIIGMSGLIPQRFGEAAKKNMLVSMSSAKRATVRPDKNPDREMQDCFYRLEGGGYGHPAIGFKLATIAAARFFGTSVTMVGVTQWVNINGHADVDDEQLLVQIIPNGEPVQRCDRVVLKGGKPDLRFRPMFKHGWKAVLDISYVKSSITRESVIELVDAGGQYVGVGAWRPEKRGPFGRYRVNREDEIRAIGLERG